MISLSSFHNCQ